VLTSFPRDLIGVIAGSDGRKFCVFEMDYDVLQIECSDSSVLDIQPISVASDQVIMKRIHRALMDPVFPWLAKFINMRWSRLCDVSHEVVPDIRPDIRPHLEKYERDDALMMVRTYAENTRASADLQQTIETYFDLLDPDAMFALLRQGRVESRGESELTISFAHGLGDPLHLVLNQRKCVISSPSDLPLVRARCKIDSTTFCFQDSDPAGSSVEWMDKKEWTISQHANKYNTCVPPRHGTTQAPRCSTGCFPEGHPRR
jgi:hypothetical protein